MKPEEIIKEFKSSLGKETPLGIHGAFSPFLILVPWVYPDDKNRLDVLCANKGRDTSAVISFDRYVGFSRDMFVRFLAGSVTVDDVRRRYLAFCKKVDDQYRDFSVGRAQLRSMLAKELQEKLKAARQLLSDLISETMHIETFDKDVALESLNDERGTQLSEHWEQMTYPAFLSFENRRHADIFALLETHPIEEAAPLVRYMYTDYANVHNAHFVEEEMRKLLQDKKAVKEKIRKQEHQIGAAHKSWPDGLAPIIEYVQFVMHLRDVRKDTIAKMQTVMFDIAEELFTRAGLEADDIHTFLSDEISVMDFADIRGIQRSIQDRSAGIIFIIRPDSSYAVAPYDLEKSFKAIEEILHPEGMQEITELKGSSASRGIVKGLVRVVLDAKHTAFADGEILVTSMTRPEFVPLMKRAGAIVTNEGGITCHAAIVSRELGKPCVIGTKIATQVLKDGDLVEVDADRGVVRVVMRAGKQI